MMRIDDPSSADASTTLCSNPVITLWLNDVIPIFFPDLIKEVIILAAVWLLPVPGGPCTGNTLLLSSITHFTAFSWALPVFSIAEMMRGGVFNKRSLAALY